LKVTNRVMDGVGNMEKFAKLVEKAKVDEKNEAD
jgi:hypothetical protein